MSDTRRKKGVRATPTDEQLRAFRAIPAAEKLRWLEEMRQFLQKALPPEKIEILNKFRDGEI